VSDILDKIKLLDPDSKEYKENYRYMAIWQRQRPIQFWFEMNKKQNAYKRYTGKAGNKKRRK
jgi:hypothetical protein